MSKGQQSNKAYFITVARPLSPQAKCARTRERSQLDTTGHVIIKVDSPSSAVALYDGVQSLRTDAVA